MEPEELAPARTPLGKLQRGRGAGFLWSLENPDAARPLLLACITQDPRWDRQVESRATYYAEIALAVGLDLRLLERHLREHDDTDDEGYESRLTVETLHALTAAGVAEALRIQSEYIAYGAHWSAALNGLALLSEDPAPPAGVPQALNDLLAVVRSRFSDQNALDAALDPEWPNYKPWREWAKRDAVIAAALAKTETAYLKHENPRAQVTALSTREILARPDVRTLSRELAARRAPDDAAVLLETVRQGSGDAQIAALIALGNQGDPRVVEPALALLPSVPAPPSPSFLRRAIQKALSGLPADPGLAYARQWHASDNFVLHRSGEKLLEKFAEAADVPLLREVAQRAVAEGDDPAVHWTMNALARFPQFGPYAEVREAFDSHPCSRARAEAAVALAATDPAFPRDRAFESLWDCDDRVRATGCQHVDLGLPGARARIAHMAADSLQDEDVCEAARLALTRVP